MKIYFNNNNQGKIKAFITHNGELHELEPGQTLELNVKRGEQVTYKVGRLSAEHTIDYQSTDAEFEITQNRVLLYAYLAALVVILVGLWYLKNISNSILTIVVIVGLVIFEAFNYFNGYQAHPVHRS